MGVVPVRPQAIEAAAKAGYEAVRLAMRNPEFIKGWDDAVPELKESSRREMEAGIQAFLAAEEISLERAAARTGRLCGPWRREDG